MCTVKIRQAADAPIDATTRTTVTINKAVPNIWNIMTASIHAGMEVQVSVNRTVYL